MQRWNHIGRFAVLLPFGPSRAIRTTYSLSFAQVPPPSVASPDVVVSALYHMI